MVWKSPPYYMKLSTRARRIGSFFSSTRLPARTRTISPFSSPHLVSTTRLILKSWESKRVQEEDYALVGREDE